MKKPRMVPVYLKNSIVTHIAETPDVCNQTYYKLSIGFPIKKVYHDHGGHKIHIEVHKKWLI